MKEKAIIAQSGGCTAVINQSLAGVIDEARASKKISKVFGSKFGVEGILKNELVELSSKSPSLLKQIRYLPSSALGSSRYKLKEGEEQLVLEKLKKQGIRYLFMVGGNDTADTILRIAKAAERTAYDLKAIHIPKTIDNDLMETDHCPGYGSVARFAAITTQEAGLDSQSMQRVDRIKIIELMGRNSGWIVAASALLKKTEIDPPHLLWLPEVPFDESIFLSRVEKSLRKAGYCVAVISETIRTANGQRLGIRKEGITRDPFGHLYVEGAAATLVRLAESRFKVRARFDKPGTIQRMSIPYISEVDQLEAYDAGRHAVKWALEGKTHVMVGFERLNGKSYKIAYRPVPLEKIPGRERYLRPEFLTPDKTGITSAFAKYALPLLGKKLPAFPTLI